jgi:small basic protein
VLDVYATENTTSSPITVGGVTLVAHSIYVAVVGGEAANIAQAIWNKKSLGADYNGNTSFTVSDTSGYDYPYPSYVVTWETPAPLPILFAVQIANNPQLPSNIIPLVQQAIIASFNGTDGGTRARIGSTIFASRFYGNIVTLGPTVSILSLLLGPTTPTLASYAVPINNTPTIDASNISVTLV